MGERYAGPLPGTAQVHDAVGKSVGEVTQELYVRRGKPKVVRTKNGTGALSGNDQVMGRVVGLDNHAMWNKQLILHLEDGWRLDFQVGPDGEVTANSGFYRPD